MMELKKGIPPLPPRILALPRDDRGYPVPWFVSWVEMGSRAVPDFRYVRPERATEALNFNRCWICGDKLGAYKTFAIGPMCAVNRVSSEPGSHLECAQFAVKACPFLVNPAMRRNEKNVPEGIQDPAGCMIKRNPGVTLLWTAKKFTVERHRLDDGRSGLLFRLDQKPTSVEWWCRGRLATRAEVMDSIESGLPLLQQMADAEGPNASLLLKRQMEAAVKLVPA